MGCAPSRIDETDFYFTELDRDDLDVPPCGCGPWYGGSTYRMARREYLPGCGSPRGNYFGRGGYAGIFADTAVERATALDTPMRAIPPVQCGYIGPTGLDMTVQPGYAGFMECNPYSGCGYNGDFNGRYLTTGAGRPGLVAMW